MADHMSQIIDGLETVMTFLCFDVIPAVLSSSKSFQSASHAPPALPHMLLWRLEEINDAIYVYDTTIATSQELV